MQTRSQANEKEQQAPQVDAESPNLGADVLLNSLLLAHIWENLDANAKKQLRAVARGVRALADGLVVQLATHDKPAADLAAALARWPDVEVLAADCDDESGSVISAAPLPKLRMLSLEYSSEGYGDEFSVPSLSHTAAAGLQGLYVSRAHCMQPILLSIEALRGCAQLRTLVIEGGVLSDLSALAGCVHLEELTTGLEVGSDVSDLSPLGAW
ncbi:hypothetical protein FOA52_013718 [Chlamydomonas sp. UWO 241]|nr:hypothetical protein FOA52_013718 [Chlamydomonas sp. UWO 241]